MSFKTGKKPAVESPHDLRMTSFLRKAVALPTPPARFGHGSMFRDWLMLGNGPDDTVRPGFGGAGDCVFAGAAHETMLTNRLAGKDVRFTGANAISDYSAVTGYVVGDESTDEGTDVRAALSYRRKVGVVDARGTRHKIGAYLHIDPKDWDLLMQAVFVFSAVGIGFNFPDSAMAQFDAGKTWDVVAGAKVDGGHYVPIVGRSSRSVAGAISWGRRQGMTKAFYEAYNDEAWAIVFPEELRASGLNERGLNLSALNAARAGI